MDMNYIVKHNTEWELEDLGVIDEFVYDIETENHMFFANDILNHNSNIFNSTLNFRLKLQRPLFE